MESPDGQRGRDTAGQRRSPLDLIMSQIRRKRSAADRRSSSGRFLSRTSDKGGGGGIPEDRDTEDRDHRDGTDGSGVEPAENESDLGWGRMCAFLQKLGKKADSRSLNVAHCDLTATDILELATLLQYLPQLEDMDISWNELIGGSLRALTSHLQHVGGLRTLRLCSCRLNTDDVVALGEALGCVPLLEMLDLSWNVGVGGGALQGLLGKLRPTLRQLHLVACQLTAADATALGGIVSALPRLCVLDVSCNPLLSEDESHDEAESSGGSLGGLSASLCHATSLATLRLQACGLTPNSLHALGGSLRYLPSLRELDLSCNKSLAGGLSHLTFHLVHLTHLESLDLHLCCLTHADLESLIQALPSLAELTELDVSSNKEVGGVVHSLGSALPLAQMRHLPLNSCSLNEVSFTAFALAVPYLRSVDVSWCKVVGGRLTLLLDALQPSVIQELRLSSCQLTTDDLHHLAAACKRGSLSSLRMLDLSYNGQVGDEGWTALFGAAGAPVGGGGGLGSLQEVDLSLRPSTSAAPSSAAAWLPALLSALPRLPALTRLAMQRWAISSSSSRGREQLKHSLKKRKVLLEWDRPPPAKADDDDAVKRDLMTNRDGAAEETHPEE